MIEVVVEWLMGVYFMQICWYFVWLYLIMVFVGFFYGISMEVYYFVFNYYVEIIVVG